jgi:uracil-DNA glycosylase family 4
VSDPSDVRKALASWVGYLGDLGVRELTFDAVPSAHSPASAQTDTAANGRTRAAEPPSQREVEVGAEALPASPAPSGLSLEQIRSDLGDCRRCKLCEKRTNIVFGVGDPHARLMFVGEGPGADEDAQGEPFVGRAGQKLNEMIRAIGLDRKDVYIANVVKCRPPGNRDPEPDEVATCSPFLFRQIEAISPKVIVALGSPAAKTLLGTKVGITALRGNWSRFRGIPVMPTFHPAYLLRAYTMENRRLVFEDLKAARARIDEES